MGESRFCLVVFVALVLGLSLMVPAVDVPETAYDESEALPYEGTPWLSLAAPEPFAEAPALRNHASRPGRRALVRTLPGCPRKNGSSVRIAHSLTILDHSFRC